MGDKPPRSRRSKRPGQAENGETDRHPRRRRLALYIAGGLLGSGWWLSSTVYDSPVFSRMPTTVHLPQFVLASGVVFMACWGLLLILGEVTLFALAVVKAGDREQYDLYRNLMILWGYVLTLGIPRLFRKLPAQFTASPDDDADVRRGPGTKDVDPGWRRDAGRHRQRRRAPRGTPSEAPPAPTEPARPEPADSERLTPADSERSVPAMPVCPVPTVPERPVPTMPERLALTVPGCSASLSASCPSPYDAAEFRTALDLLLRYAVRFIDDDTAGKPAPERQSVDAVALNSSTGTGPETERDD
jgi:hypothetical protein